VVALLTGQQEALIGVSQIRAMPLIFLPVVMMAPSPTPEWSQAARYNPVDWAAPAGREALSADSDSVVCRVVTLYGKERRRSVMPEHSMAAALGGSVLKGWGDVQFSTQGFAGGQGAGESAGHGVPR